VNALTSIRAMSCLLLFAGASQSALSQQTDVDSCPLSAFKDGQLVTFHARVGQSPHDGILLVPGCSESVIFVYPNEATSKESSSGLRNAEAIRRFQKYSSATYDKIGRHGICMQCPKYEVEATFTGLLNVAPTVFPEGQWKDKLGLLHDQAGRFVGQAGFGHPPIYQYQLVIEAVSDLAARKLPKPRAPGT
jgi:hypothetical protein